jgi:hypothetical protein
MSAHINIHFAGEIEARAGGTSGAPLIIKIGRKWPALDDEVTLFTDDAALSSKLADAINDTIAAHKEELAARKHREVKPFGPDDIVYREFHISNDGFGWSYSHDDYDGAPDANDNRCGHASSLQAAKAEIDEWWSEHPRAAGELMDMHDKTMAMVKSVVGID